MLLAVTFHSRTSSFVVGVESVIAIHWENIQDHCTLAPFRYHRLSGPILMHLCFPYPLTDLVKFPEKMAICSSRCWEQNFWFDIKFTGCNLSAKHGVPQGI